MNKNINEYSIAELEQMIALKKKEENKAPAPLENPDFGNIVAVLKEYINELENNEEPKDVEHWVYEAAMEAVYGPKIWDWINKNT